MTLWPAEYEALREEARTVGRASMEYYTAHLAGVDPTEQLAVGRKMLAEHEQEAPGGRDEVIAGVPCRTFDPAGDERRGTYLHLHGGAMTLGSPRMNDPGNAALSERLGVRVVSVDYRLAPEHPFPAGPDDCLTVARWVLEQERGVVAIGGESAGAYFAALTLLRIRDELDAIERISGANLVFGVYDLGRTPSSRGTSPSTTLEGMPNGESGIRDMYVPGRSSEGLRDPDISPLYADLRQMPRALFTTGTADYLLDDSLFMAARWEAYGNEAELAVYPDCVHGFTGLPMALAERANARIGRFLADTFASTNGSSRMTLWPHEYEALREEAHAAGTAAATAFRGRIDGLSSAERLALGRKFLEAQAQDAPGGRDEVIAGITCRVFDPAGGDRAGTYLNIHGGAMMWGSPRMNDNANDEVAKRLGVRVVSPDYRLAPEHPHPAGADDCLAVAQWVLEHEPGPIVVGGESAGGYFSALTLLRIRDELDAIDRVSGANLVFGVFDLGGTPSNRGARPTDMPEILEGNTDYVLEVFVPGKTREDVRDPSISPLYAELWNMPPALFTVGLADRLLDDSLFMAAGWQAYGGVAELAVYPDCAHGFTFFPIELARRANAHIEKFLAASFGVA